MKILFVCSVFPPDIGGPAIYTKELMHELKGGGYSVEILSGKEARSITSIMREMRSCDICYVMSSSPALLVPAYIASRILGKKVLVRVGGDFLWERAQEKRKTNVTLREYYENRAISIKERMLRQILKYLFLKIDFTIFTTTFQKNLYIRHYGLKNSKGVIIENPFPKCNKAKRIFPEEPLVVIYAGRLIKLKNLTTLIQAFKEVKDTNKHQRMLLKIIGNGPDKERLEEFVKKIGMSDFIIFEKDVSHTDLIKEIKNGWLAVLPSYSEISPNFVLESCACGTPVILTSESGLPESITSELITFDPYNPKILTEHMKNLTNQNRWLEYQDKIMQINTNKSYYDVAKEHDKVFKMLYEG